MNKSDENELNQREQKEKQCKQGNKGRRKRKPGTKDQIIDPFDASADACGRVVIPVVPNCEEVTNTRKSRRTRKVIVYDTL